MISARSITPGSQACCVSHPNCSLPAPSLYTLPTKLTLRLIAKPRKQSSSASFPCRSANNPYVQPRFKPAGEASCSCTLGGSNSKTKMFQFYRPAFRSRLEKMLVFRRLQIRLVPEHISIKVRQKVTLTSAERSSPADKHGSPRPTSPENTRAGKQLKAITSTVTRALLGELK